jgi:adenosylhomocysteinase
MEGTTSGIKRIESLASSPKFRVVDWNSAPLKLEIHNEKMVGFSLWQTFTEVTRLSLHGKSVGVLGFGLVGKGIARTARVLGGSVNVFDPDKERTTCAAYEGFRCPGREEVLKSDVIVTSTGVSNAVIPEDLALFKEGAFLLNAGHSEEEIHETIRDHPSRSAVLRHVEELVAETGNRFFLLAGGRLGDTINAFDVTSAILVETLAELLSQG